MSTIEAVLFDLDGTLVDSKALIGVALAETLARHGVQFDPTSVDRIVGPPMTVMIQRVGGVPLEVAHSIFREYTDLYLGEYAPRTQPMPGAVALLEALGAADVPLALVTNKDESGARTALGYLGWSERFAAIVGADSTAHPKPEAEHAIEALRRLNAHAASTAYVGDLDVDMACGSVAGLARVIGLANGMAPEALRAAGVTHVCATLAEVATILDLPRPAQVSR
ncbi:MAG: HAD family hydrolase [Dehalococcoidia bacterium]|nr:HAD family hydrolase [Dehalococcoidia bacterium]